MPARKKAAAAKPKSYLEKIVEAITDLKDRTGSSPIAIEKWIQANYKRDNYNRRYLRNALKSGVEKGTIAIHHNHKGSYKLGKAPAKPKKKKAPAKKKAPKKKTTKKKTTKKKKPAKKKTTKKKKP